MTPNPYAPPASATVVTTRPFGRFERLTSTALFFGCVCAVLVTAGTENLTLGMAALCASLCYHLHQAAFISWLTERDQAPAEPAMDHRKVAMPEPRHQEGDRYAYGATSAHDRRLWNHRPGGFALPQLLWVITALIGAPALFALLCFIATAVMGMDEPRW